MQVAGTAMSAGARGSALLLSGSGSEPLATG